jgi:hypothetical protein
MATKLDAMNFFSDLLGLPEPETLFGTKVDKRPKRARKWRVAGISVIHKVSSCKCCGARIEHINPHLLFRKELVDHTDTIIKTIETDCPDEADLLLLNADSPVEHRYVATNDVAACNVCWKAIPDTLYMKAFKAQVDRLQADPERRKAIAEQREAAEKQLMELIDGFDYSTDTSSTQIGTDSDLPY